MFYIMASVCSLLFVSLAQSAIIWLSVVAQESSNSNGAIFEVEPQSLNVTEGDRAMYSCTPNSTSGYQFTSVTWTVNGTFLNQYRGDSEGISASSGGQQIYSQLNIVAFQRFNNTFVECVALSSTAGNILRSRSAGLFVQGHLGPILNISTQLIEPSFVLLLNWIAPFTLDISNTEIDMTFCVHVFNHSSQEHILSVCRINETKYNFTAEQLGASPCDSFEFRVIAVNGVGSGRNDSYTVGYFYPSPLNFSSTEVLTDVSILPTSEIKIMFNIPFIHVCSCKVYFNSRQSDTNIELVPHDCSSNSLMILLNRAYQDDFYNITIQISNSAGQAYSDGLLEISTHDIQGATANTTSQTDSLEIELLFARHSQATGALVILSPVFESQITIYAVVRRTKEAIHQLAYLTPPPSGVYDIFIYDIERNGRPQSRSSPAVVINEFEITDGSAFVEVLTSPNIQVNSGNRSVCVACSVSTSSNALGCVAVLHSTEDLSSIIVKEIHKELLQPQCVCGLDKGNYSVAVFEWKDTGRMSTKPVTVVNVVVLTSLWSTTASEIPSETINKWKLPVTIASGPVGILGLVLLAACVGVRFAKKKYRSQKSKCEVSSQEFVQDITIKQVPLNDNPAYGSVKGRDAISPRSTEHMIDLVQDTTIIYESIMD